MYVRMYVKQVYNIRSIIIEVYDQTSAERESVCSREKVMVTLRQKYQQEEGIGNRLFLLIYLAERMGGCVAQSLQSENCIQCRFAERRVESTAPKRLYYY